MSDLIEKLIKPIDTMYLALSSRHELQDKILELEQQRNEILEDNIENLICLENIYKNTNLGIYGMVLRSRIDNTKHAIEKATEKLWSKVKELL